MAFALALHLLGIIVWVGGMFFTIMVLRGAVNSALEPNERLLLMLKVFDGFFPWVWLSVMLILASGYWMLFFNFEEETTFWLGFMSLGGTLMAAIFVFIYAIPYNQLGNALKSHDMPMAVSAITLIRQLILTNLSLGIVITVITLFGKYSLI